MTATTLTPPQTEDRSGIDLSEEPNNPWVADHVLLGMSVWWVQVDSPNTQNFVAEVREVFEFLQNHVQRR